MVWVAVLFGYALFLMNIGRTRAEYLSRFLMQGRRIEASILATVDGATQIY